MYTREIQFDLINFMQPFTVCLNRVKQKVAKFFNSNWISRVNIQDAIMLVSQKELFSKVNTMATNVVEQL